MATASEVLSMLIPTGGWIVRGNDWEGVEFLECEPITKKQFTDGFAQYDSWKAEQENLKVKARATVEAKLALLGLTTEDLKALGL